MWCGVVCVRGLQHIDFTLFVFWTPYAEPLDQLTQWAIEMFSDIRNLGIQPPANTNPPWTAKELLVKMLCLPHSK